MKKKINKMEMGSLIKAVQGIKYVMDSTQTRWFIGFGVMLGILRDGEPPKDNDIDVCVYYEDYDFKRIKRAFSRAGYTMSKVVYPNVGDTPLYSHFRHSSYPDMCLFAWYEHKGIRYHTYDYYNEGRERLKRYRDRKSVV